MGSIHMDCCGMNVPPSAHPQVSSHHIYTRVEVTFMNASKTWNSPFLGTHARAVQEVVQLLTPFPAARMPIT